MRRRTVVSAVASAVGVGTTAGCLSSDGSSGTNDDGESGDQESLADTTAADGGGGAGTTEGGDGGGGDDGPADVDFGAEVESIEKCSTTCRTLTYALRNRGSDAAADVVVGVRVFTGGENVYDEEQAVGTVDAGSQRTGITRDIDVGLMGAQSIKSNDGEIRIELTPTAGEVSETFEFEATLDV